MKMHKYLILIFLLATSLLVFTGCTIEDNNREYYEIIKREYENENYKEVSRLLDECPIVSFRRPSWYYYYYGLVSYKESRYNARFAIKQLTSALEIDSKQPLYSFCLGKMYFCIGEYKDAEKFFLAAENLYKKTFAKSFDEALLWCGITYYKLHECDKIERLFNYSDSALLNNFWNQISSDEISEKYLNDILSNTTLELDDKIVLTDILLSHFAITDDLCERMIQKQFDPDILKCFYIRLIFNNMEDKEKCEAILSEIGYKFDSQKEYWIQTNSEYISQLFSKCLCFYYYKNNEENNAYSKLRAYKRSKYKNEEYVIRKNNDYESFDNDFESIKREFAQDEDFLRLFGGENSIEQ